MGSSGDDYSVPPQQPAPPSGTITPFGQPSPDQGWQGINFLDNNTATGITPAMDAQIKAMSGPPPGAMGPPGGGMPTQTPPDAQRDPRVALAAAMAALPKGQGNITMGGAAPRWAEGGGGPNRGGYGSSAGGRY